MSLLFTDGGTNRVDHGSGASLDDPAALTLILRIYPITIATVRNLVVKSDGSLNKKQFTFRQDGNIDLFISTSGTAISARSSSLTPTANNWFDIAWTVSSGLAPHIYIGSPTANFAEPTYSVGPTTGTGTMDTEAAGNFIVGNRQAVDNAFGGRIELVHYLNRDLSLGELKDQQFNPHVVSGSKLFVFEGANGTGTQTDWSGNANAGTVTGATVAANSPRRAWFGHDMERNTTIAAAVTGWAPLLGMERNRLIRAA